MKKSKFLSFVFSLVPGAGHMYLGLMKLGLSYMILFFSAVAVITLTNLGILGVFLAVIWFFAFFDCLNKTYLPYEELDKIEDKLIFDKVFSGDIIKGSSLIIGISLVVVGIIVLINGALNNILPEFISHQLLWRIRDVLPKIIISAILIFIGTKLIIGNKVNANKEEQE